MPVPIHRKTFDLDGSVIETDFVKASDWLRFFISKCPCLVAGSDLPLTEQISSFWAMYKWHHADHEIYEKSSARRAATIPIMIFGDEGKGPKRGNYMITTLEFPIGLSEATPAECSCHDFVETHANEAPDCYGVVAEQSESEAAARLSTNVKGNSYLTRHLLFGLQDTVYKDYPQVYDNMLEVIADDLTLLFEQGIDVRGTRFYAALIGNKGDLKHMAEKTCKLTRSYAHLGSKNQNEICHLCLAGGPNLPWEEAGHRPRWLDFMHVARPWLEEPVLSRVPFDNHRPELLYRLDLFHLYKVGIGRDIAGAVCFLARLGYYDLPNESRNMAARLRRAHRSFKLYCLANKRSAALRYFSLSFFNLSKRLSDFAWSNSKASDTMLLLDYLRWFVSLQLREALPPEHRRLFRLLDKTIEHGGKIIQICYSHPLWLERACGQALYLHFQTFLAGYQALARVAMEMRYSFFAMKPKFHALNHLAQDLRQVLLTPSPKVLNPACWSCDMNEDCVGKLCSLALVVSTRTINKRVMQRSFLKKKAVLERHLAFRHRSGLRV